MAVTTQDIASDLAPTGVLRASINLGNPVLAQGTATDPSGVTVDLAREIGRRLALPVELVCFDAARRSLEAMVAGDADICFLAIEPAREAEVAFTPPYVVIEGVFAVPEGSPVQASADVDRPGVRVGVKRGSAYDRYLTRTLQHAEIVRGEEGTAVFLDEDLDVAAGIRQPLTAFVRDRTDLAWSTSASWRSARRWAPPGPAVPRRWSSCVRPPGGPAGAPDYSPAERQLASNFTLAC